MKELIRQCRRSIAQLIAHMPAVYEAMGRDATQLRELDGWRAMQQRYRVWERRGEEPALVAVLYGPTGAGKSTLLRLLTGCDVPAGGDERPMSYACCVAVPAELNGQLQDLFPEYRLQPLEDPAQLRERGDSDLLFHVTYMPREAGTQLPPVIADVPDFNSVERTNWEKAARMLDRAEIVLFLVYDEAYKNAQTLEHLHRCSQRAAFMAVVLTKCSAESARRKWADLLAYVRTADPESRFQERRQNGQRLHEFLAACPVYASPRAGSGEEPRLAEIEPLEAETPPLTSLLAGADQQRILRESLLQATAQVVGRVQGLLEEAAGEAERLRESLEQVEADVRKAAASVAGSEFPLGPFFTVVLEEVRSRQSALRRALGGAVTRLGRGLQELRRGLMGLGDRPEMRRREEIERQRLPEVANDLVKGWRERHPELFAPGAALSESRVGRVREELLARPTPTPGRQWEAAVREAAAAWCDDHPARVRYVPVVLDGVLVAGVGLLTLDLATTGGLGGAFVGTLGVGGAAAGGVSAAALFARVVHRLGLHEPLRVAHEQWLQQRTQELAGHLERAFADPLLSGPWRERLEALERAPIGVCREACGTLLRLRGGDS